jgi:hypothetical protein
MRHAPISLKSTKAKIFAKGFCPDAFEEDAAINNKKKIQAMKSYFHPRSLLVQLLSIGLLAALPAKAITVFNYWRMGENDPGAAAGGFCTNAVDGIGVYPLTNTPYLSAYPVYTNDVSPVAATTTGSRLALRFDGNQYATGTLLTGMSSGFVLELWAKADNTTGSKVLAYNGNTSLNGWGIVQVGLAYEALFGGITLFGWGLATPNAWTHLALVHDSGTTTFYVNGVAAGSTTNAPNPATGNFQIGANNLHGETFVGDLDEVRVFGFGGAFYSTNLLYFQTPSFALSTNSFTAAAAAGTNSVALIMTPPDVTWTASANVPWLHLATNSGTGNATVTFSYDDNPWVTRAGTLTIAGQTFTVIQGPPAYSLLGNYDFYWTGDVFEESASAGSDSLGIHVTPEAGTWTVDCRANWIHMTQGGTGSGTIQFTYDANTDPGGAARMGQVYINNGANSLLRFVVFQQAPSSGSNQITYHFTGRLAAYLPEYIPADASPALKSVQDGDIFYLTMTFVPSPMFIYAETWACAVNNIIFSVPSRGLVYTRSFNDLEVLEETYNPHTLRWDMDGVDSTVDLIFWARDFTDTALKSVTVPNPLDLSGFHSNGFSQVSLFNGIGLNPTLFYGELVPLPSLSLRQQQNTDIVSWVTTDTYYTPQLETSFSLGPNAVWMNVTNVPVQQGLTNILTLPKTNSGAQFFRLKVLQGGI